MDRPNRFINNPRLYFCRQCRTTSTNPDQGLICPNCSQQYVNVIIRQLQNQELSPADQPPVAAPNNVGEHAVASAQAAEPHNDGLPNFLGTSFLDYSEPVLQTRPRAVRPVLQLHEAISAAANAQAAEPHNDELTNFSTPAFLNLPEHGLPTRPRTTSPSLELQEAPNPAASVQAVAPHNDVLLNFSTTSYFNLTEHVLQTRPRTARLGHELQETITGDREGPDVADIVRIRARDFDTLAPNAVIILGLNVLVSQPTENEIRGRSPFKFLSTKKVTTEQTQAMLQCSICQDNYIRDELLTELPCMHIFHFRCIRSWFEIQSTCPLCRYDLAPLRHNAIDQVVPAPRTVEMVVTNTVPGHEAFIVNQVSQLGTAAVSNNEYRLVVTYFEPTAGGNYNFISLVPAGIKNYNNNLENDEVDNTLNSFEIVVFSNVPGIDAILVKQVQLEEPAILYNNANLPEPETDAVNNYATAQEPATINNDVSASNVQRQESIPPEHDSNSFNSRRRTYQLSDLPLHCDAKRRK